MNPYYLAWLDITNKLDQMQMALFAAAAAIYWISTAAISYRRGCR